MPRNAFPALYFLLAALLLQCEPTFAAPNAVDIELQAVFFIRTLIYEHNTGAQTQKSIKLAIVHQAEPLAVEELIHTFSTASTNGIKGKPVEVVAIPFNKISDLRERISALSIDAVYIDKSANEALSSILQVTRALQTPSFASSLDMVKKGASLGVYLVDARPRLIINLRAAQLENIVLPAGVLRVSTLIK